MRSRGLLFAGALACACGKKDAAPATGSAAAAPARDASASASAANAGPAAAAEQPPEVTFAVSDEQGLTVYRTGAAGVTKVKSAPSSALEYDFDLVWTAPDALFVRIGTAVFKAQGDQLVAVPLPPPRTFAVTRGKGESHFDQPESTLVATAAGELWLGRCEWGDTGPETSHCEKWAYARLAPAPVVARHDEPESRKFAPPAVTPPVAVKVEIALEHVVDAGPDDYTPTPNKILHCTIGGKTIEYPDLDSRGSGFAGIDDLVWLSAAPPVFTVNRYDAGFSEAIPSAMVFEGCTPSNTDDHVFITYGPHDVFAIQTGDKTSIRWHGRELGTVDATRVAFAP